MKSWVSRGINVITPNKQSNSGPLASYLGLREATRKHQRYFLYETNVGAGLPIIHTLRGLIETGDQIIKIEGVLSGTLSYILNSFDGSRTFSEIVREAHKLGLTEPDPRLDLSGSRRSPEADHSCTRDGTSGRDGRCRSRKHGA